MKCNRAQDSECTLDNGVGSIKNLKISSRNFDIFGNIEKIIEMKLGKETQNVWRMKSIA